MTTRMTGEDNNVTVSDALGSSGSLQSSWAPPKSARERQYESAYRRALGDTLTWIERSTGLRFAGKPPPEAAYPPGLFRQLLSDGVQLCELLNALRPGCVKKINRAKNRIAGLDNLALFIQTCDQMFSVPKLSMFEVSDVIEDLSEKYSPEDAVYEDERRCKKILTCLLRLHRFVDLRPSTPRLELSALMAVLGGGSGGGGGGGGSGSRPSSAGSRDSTAASADPPSVQLTQSSGARAPVIASSVNPLQFVRPEGNELVESARNQLRVIQRNKEQLAEAAAAAAAADAAASRGDRKVDSEGDAWISSLNCWKERRRQTLQNSGALQRLGLLEEQEAAETRRETQKAMDAARSRNRSIGQALKERARSLGHLDSEDFEEEPSDPAPKAMSPAPIDLKSTEAEKSSPRQNRSAALYERQTSQPAPTKSPSPPPVRNISAALFDRSRSSPPQSPKRRSPTAASFDLRKSPPSSPKRNYPTAASFDLQRSPASSPKRHSPIAASLNLRKSPPQSPKRRSPTVLDRSASPLMPTPQAEQLSISSSSGRFREELRVACGISLGLREPSVSTAKSPTAEASSSSPLLSQPPRSGPLPWERRQEFRPVSSKFNAAIAATSPRSRYADVSASTLDSRLTTSTSLTTEEEKQPTLSRSGTTISPQTQLLLCQSMPDYTTVASTTTAGKDPFKNLTNGCGGGASQKPMQPTSPQKLLQNQTLMEQHEDQRATRMTRRSEAQLKHRSQSSDGGGRGLTEPDNAAPPPNTSANPDVSLRRQQAPPPPLPPRTSTSSGNLQLAGATDERERPLSVSGKKRCSHCFSELGSGGAMAIESLGLYYHIKCFRCCVCLTPLGNGTTGADVRVRRDRLHCPGCFSSDEAGP